jgi:hypothetical protein
VKTKMKFFKTIFMFTVISMISYSAFSQQESTFKVVYLKNKTWCMQGMSDKTTEAKYNDGNIIYLLTDASKSAYTFVTEYYLSNSIETVFDSTKVGNIKEGNYIISRILKDKKSHPNQPQPVSVFEIKELSSTKLVLKDIKQQNLIEFLAKE